MYIYIYIYIEILVEHELFSTIPSTKPNPHNFES